MLSPCMRSAGDRTQHATFKIREWTVSKRMSACKRCFILKTSICSSAPPCSHVELSQATIFPLSCMSTNFLLYCTFDLIYRLDSSRRRFLKPPSVTLPLSSETSNSSRLYSTRANSQGYQLHVCLFTAEHQPLSYAINQNLTPHLVDWSSKTSSMRWYRL